MDDTSLGWKQIIAKIVTKLNFHLINDGCWCTFWLENNELNNNFLLRFSLRSGTLSSEKCQLIMVSVENEYYDSLGH